MLEKNIYLIGFMGTGKTTISKKLNEITHSDEIDIDQEIVKKEGKTIPEIFKEFGENYFRVLETTCLNEVSKQSGKIVSCGGGIVLSNENVKRMKESGKIILLEAKPETIYERIKNDKNRPLLAGKMSMDYIAQMKRERKDIYDKSKDFKVDTDGKTVEQIAVEIKKLVETS